MLRTFNLRLLIAFFWVASFTMDFFVAALETVPVTDASSPSSNDATTSTENSNLASTDEIKKQRKRKGSIPLLQDNRQKDAEPDAMSDRVFKSSIYTPEEIDAIKEIGWDEDVNPKTLEISFDNLCNLSCSYCNPEFSTTWANDIKTNGIYENMKTSGGGAYQNDGDHAYSFGLKGGDGNLFTKAFFKWFDNGLKEDLQELRVTGGEPTRSPDFWKLVDKCEGEKFNFAINSNLILVDKMMDKLIDASGKFQTFDLYTSCETAGKHAELIRHGFKYI